MLVQCLDAVHLERKWGCRGDVEECRRDAVANREACIVPGTITTKLTRASIVVAMLDNYNSQCQKANVNCSGWFCNNARGRLCCANIASQKAYESLRSRGTRLCQGGIIEWRRGLQSTLESTGRRYHDSPM